VRGSTETVRAWPLTTKLTGKRADFVVVDLTDPAVQPVYDPIAAMVYSASRHNIRATFIGGQETNVDYRDLVRECAAIAEQLRRK